MGVAVILLVMLTQRPAQAQLDLVEVVGCLETAVDGPWVIAQASEPALAKAPWTTADAVQAAAGRPLGARRYRLIGVNPFSPARRIGHKVAVKGILIRDAAGSRINVTSLQSADVSCRKQDDPGY